MQYKLRPYQSGACRSIMAEFEQGTKRTLLILPTGGGKTIVLSGIAYKFAYDRNRNPTGGRVLILAHQNILINQAADKFQTVMELPVFREQGRQTGCLEPVTVSSMQTMQRRLDRFPPDFFRLIIIDEAHHAMSAGYQRILEHFTDARVLGVTATPDRADGKKLSCFESVAFEYTIKQAIDDGYLVPLKVKRAPLTINLSKVRKRRGDMDASDLGSVIEPYLHQIVEIVRSIRADGSCALSRLSGRPRRRRRFSATTVSGLPGQPEKTMKRRTNWQPSQLVSLTSSSTPCC